MESFEGVPQAMPGKVPQSTLSVWSAIAVAMKEVGQLRMAVFLMTALSSYARPSELLRCRVFSLVRPASGITRSWSLLLSPEEFLERSKTGEYDSSISLDSPYLGNWAAKLYSVLKTAHPDEAL